MDREKYVLKTISTTCILIYILVCFAITPIIYMTITKMAHMDEDATLLTQAIINLVTYSGLTITFVILLRKYFRDDLLSLKDKWWFKLIIVLALILLIKLSEELCKWFYGLFNETINGTNQTSIVKAIKENAFIMALSTCLLAPIVEETIFRKCIFSYFEKDYIAIIVSTLAFSLIHVISSLDFIHILPYLITGALLSTGYALSKRNIYVPILAHAIVNTISYIVICINM